MKNVCLKLFALLLCSVLCCSLNAQTIVLQEDFSNITDSVSGTDVSNSLDALLQTTGWSGYKIYKNNGKIKLGTASICGWIQTPALNLAANGGTFTISFDAEAWYHDSTSLSIYVDGTEYVVTGLDNDGSYGSYNHYTLTATGGTAATNIKFSGKGGAGKTRFFLDNIVIAQNGGTPIVSTPIFSLSSGTYQNPFDVTITSTTDSTDIYYTMDGTSPDSTATLYTTPIQISQNTTLKAIAYRTGYIHSSVASATYSFPTEIANIAAFKAIGTVSSTPYKIANDVTFVYGDGKYNFVQDASGALLIYSSSSSFPTIYSEGDQISDLTGAFAQYQNQIEMTPSFSPAAATSNIGSIEPIIATIADVRTNYAQYDAQLVTLQNVTLCNALDYEAGTTGVTINISQGTDTLAIYNRFKTLDTTIAQNSVTDVTGFVAIYGSTIQIYPRSNADLELGIQTVATPTISPISGTYPDSVTVTIACTEQGADIRYTTNGTEPTEVSTLYQQSIVLTANATIKAKAFKSGYYASETATATYTIAHEPALSVTPNSLQFSQESLTATFNITTAFLTDPVMLSCNDTHFTLSTNTIPATTASAAVTVTFDGTEPATGTITISTGTLSATVALTATATLPAPVITPASGTSDTNIVITITCANGNAAIHYTTDGTTPTAASDIYSAPFEFSVPGSYTVKAIATQTNWTNSAVTEATYTVTAPVPPTPPTPTYNDTLAYATGFEVSEGFTTSTNYSDVNEALNGPANQQWAIVYGTPSTTSPISDEASLQMRWYTNAATTLGYARTNFDVSHATRIRFQAKSTNNLNAKVSYSTDGGNSYVDTIFTISSNAATYEWNFNENATFDYVRFKFAIELPETLPTSTSRLYIDSVSIFNFPSMVSHVVDMPVIAPNSGTMYEPTSVTITCATDSAQIYYTTDGTTPTAQSTLYTAPFTVSATTTVKAIAVKTGFSNSNVNTATYTFPVEVATIADFKAAHTATSTTVYRITGDVTFVYENGYYIYIQDSTAGIQVYDRNNVWNSYFEGDIISGGICGTYTLYNGLAEFVPTLAPALSVNNIGTIAPIITDVPTLINNYNEFDSRLVQLQSVTFIDGGTYSDGTAFNMNIEQNDEVMICRSMFKNLDLTIPAGQVADVTGFVTIYNSDIQIAPRSNADIIFVQLDTVEMPIIEVNPLTNAMYTVNLACATDEAQIYYTTDGTLPTEQSTLYTQSFIVQGGTTLKAIATKEGMANSSVAEYANVGINEFVANGVTISPNPTDGNVVICTNDLPVNAIELYNIEGQLLSTKSVGTGSSTLNLSSEAAGIYFVRIVGDHFNIVKKIIRK